MVLRRVVQRDGALGCLEPLAEPTLEEDGQGVGTERSHHVRDRPGALRDDEAFHDQRLTAFEVGRRVRGEPETNDGSGVTPCIVARLRECAHTFQCRDRFRHRVAAGLEQLDRERLLQGDLAPIALDALRLGGQEIERPLQMQERLVVRRARACMLGCLLVQLDRVVDHAARLGVACRELGLPHDSLRKARAGRAQRSCGPGAWPFVTTSCSRRPVRAHV